MEREVRVCGAKSGNEVILERPNGTFSIVAAVDARGNKLKGCGGVIEIVFESLATFVVHDVELWFAAMTYKSVV